MSLKALSYLGIRSDKLNDWSNGLTKGSMAFHLDSTRTAFLIKTQHQSIFQTMNLKLEAGTAF